MHFTNAQRPLYNCLASANSEASDWHPATIKAHTAFSQCGFFVRGWIAQGVFGFAVFLNRRYANLHSLPTPIGIGMGGFSKPD